MKRKYVLGIGIIGIIAMVGLWVAGLAGKKESGAGQNPKKIVAYYVDPMNPANVSDHPGKAPCGMDMVPVYAGDAKARGIRIDPSVVQNIGVTVEPVTEQALQKEIRTSGTVAADESKVYAVNAKVGGWVERLRINYTGERVSRGEPLLDLYSPELVSTQEEYLQARQYASSLAQDASPEARSGAQNLLASARTRLLNWDIPEAEIQALETRGTPAKTMTLVSPEQGVVLDKKVDQGQRVEPGTLLYTLADLSRVWILADIYQQDLPWVKVGQKAEVQMSYGAGKRFTGRVTFLSPVVDLMTKTAQARVEVANTPDLDIKPGLFATVILAAPAEKLTVVVPAQSVIHTGTRDVVIISLPNGYFEPREVKLGVTSGDKVQVLEGLASGEKLVTSSQFLIDSESNLKAAVQMLGGGSMPGMDMGNPKAGDTQISSPAEDMSNMKGGE